MKIIESILGMLHIGQISFVGFLQVVSSKASACNAGDEGLIPGLGRSPGGRNGNLVQYFCLEKSHGQRSLAGYSSWGGKESDTTEHTHTLPVPSCVVMLGTLVPIIRELTAGGRAQ